MQCLLDKSFQNYGINFINLVRNVTGCQYASDRFSGYLKINNVRPRSPHMSWLYYLVLNYDKKRSYFTPVRENEMRDHTKN